MEIKWTNLIALAMLLAAVVIGLTMHEQIAASLKSIGEIGESGDPDDQMAGLIALSILTVLIVAVVRIVVSSQDDSS